MFLKPGDRIPVSELNKGIVIQSGNDASIALADYVAGSQDAFVGLMNNYVRALGLKTPTSKLCTARMRKGSTAPRAIWR